MRRAAFRGSSEGGSFRRQRDLKSGDRIDERYEIIRQIGKGGGGIVWLAEHLNMQKKVILKEIVHDLYGMDTEILRTEVDILKRLKHPCLPQVYDYLVIAGKVYTVMEYVPGHNLQEYMDQGAHFSQQQIVVWARQLAEVLVYMHSQPHPVIHRDIKPSNIMVKPDGTICLIDFNISDDTAKHSSLSGYSRGFASPEQIEKAELEARRMSADDIVIDEKTDIYSLGAVLYYLLCGKKPTQSEKTLEEEACCFYPLARIVDRCMQKEKGRRYKNAETLLHALNHMEKSDRDYIKYTWYGRIALTAGLFVLAMGIGLLYFGYTLNQKDAYYAAYNTYMAAVSADRDSAEELALDILNHRQWKTFLDQNPEEEEKIFYELGEYFYRKEEYRNAEKYFERSVETGKASDLCYRDYARSCIMTGKLEKAESILEEAEEKGAAREQILFIKGELLFAREDYAMALSCFTEAREICFSDEQKEEAESLLAKTYIMLENYDEAEHILSDKSVHTYSDWMNLALAYQKNGKWTEAENVLQRLQSMYPDASGVYIRLALLAYETESRRPQALRDYGKMMEYYSKAKQYVGADYTEEWEQLQGLVIELEENGWL